MANTCRRYWLAVLIALVGIIMIGAGIASATIFRPADTAVASLPSSAKTQVVVTRQGVLSLYAADATISVSGPAGTIVAVGRSTDVAAWADGMEHTRIEGIDANDTFLVSTVKGNPKVKVASPADSDMWVTSQEVKGKDATISWGQQHEGQWSVVAYSPKGTPKLSIEWKTGASTPWLWPLVIAGLVTLALAALVAFLIRRRARRSEAHTAEVADADVARDEWGQPLPATEQTLADQRWVDEREAGYLAEEPYRDTEGADAPTYVEAYDGPAEYDEGYDEGYDELYDDAQYAPVRYREGDDEFADGREDPHAHYGDGGYDEDAYDEPGYAEDGYGADYVGEYSPSGYGEDYGFDDEGYEEHYDAPEGDRDAHREAAYDDAAYDDADYAQPGEEADYDDATEDAQTWDSSWEQDMARPQNLPAPPGPPTLAPTRREMREARKRGEATIEIDGVKYPTGLIPVVKEQVLALSDSEEGVSADEFSGRSAFGDEGDRS